MQQSSILWRYGFSLSAVLSLLSGCGAFRPPINAPGAMAQAPPVGAHVDANGSWMLPEAKNDDLLYAAAGDSLDSVYVFSYPAGKLVGTLTEIGMPTDECIDANGNVWIVDAEYDGGVVEYAHGGSSPIAKLSVPGPFACAIDKKTGDIAVTSGRDTVSIFRHARGKPQTYSDDHMAWVTFCAYDDSANLFLSAEDWGYTQRLFKLSLTKSRLVMIGGLPGFSEDAPIFWDGKYLAVGVGYSREPATIERITVTGSKGTIQNTVTLSNAPPFNAELLAFRGNLVEPEGGGVIDVWRYPHVQLEETIGRPSDPIEYLGVAVSVAR